MFNIVLLVLLLSHIQLAFSVHCEKAWFNHQSKCYWKSKVYATHADNWQLCKELDAKMVSIKTVDENEFIRDLVRGDDQRYWLSGYQVKPGKNEFVWEDGSKLTYSNWSIGEPNDFRQQGRICLNMFTTGGWNDQTCFARAKMLCEKQGTETKSGC